MKATIYIILTLILSTTALAASWGDVDFRILASDDDLVFPIVLEFQNSQGKDLNAQLLIETLSPDADFGPSEYEQDIVISKDPELLRVDLPITEAEKNYDVWVSVWVDDELADKMYNSLVRLKPEMLAETNKLPPKPGEVLQQQMDEAADFAARLREKYPNIDEMDTQDAMIIVHKEMAQEEGLSEKEYLQKLGSDADTIEEAFGRPAPESQEQADVPQPQANVEKKAIEDSSSTANIIGSIIAVILMIGVIGIGYIFFIKKR
ncbi:hypothetical protein COV20_03690 [Candidatus Woesearchaeota archaeon CG10_big_fil_rev_8_21_14_0_10_45_16]|nr:MAG: hypothetical protein COV20_03690 [Candidatus Woesearchaeota archaeon CG10_big_fil_rev_8_21_14_0_10_45_16]